MVIPGNFLVIPVAYVASLCCGFFVQQHYILLWFSKTLSVPSACCSTTCSTSTISTGTGTTGTIRTTSTGTISTTSTTSGTISTTSTTSNY